VREELALAQRHADAVGAGVEGPDEQHGQQDPAAAGPKPGQRRARRQRRRNLIEPDQTAEHAHVYGRESSTDPRREANLDVILAKRGDAGGNHHRRDQQICVRAIVLN
jgi:hypothetical protein